MDSDKNECNTLVSDMHGKQYGETKPINIILKQYCWCLDFQHQYRYKLNKKNIHTLFLASTEHI